MSALDVSATEEYERIAKVRDPTQGVHSQRQRVRQGGTENAEFSGFRRYSFLSSRDARLLTAWLGGGVGSVGSWRWLRSVARVSCRVR
jgi:hypothetical protein